jgi:GTP-binding protein
VLNQLTGNRRTAKVSKTPGRTQLLNFFSVRQEGRLVDLPGYGYAKATLNAQQQWQKAVNHYLSYRDSLVGLVLVMDIRHPNQPFDKDLLSWAQESGLPIHILLNKADKLGRNAQQKALSQLQRAYADHPTASMQCFSAAKGSGKEQLMELLLQWLATPITPPE